MNLNFNTGIKFAGMMCVCGALMMVAPVTAEAAADTQSQTAVQTTTEMVAKIDVPSISIFADQDAQSAVIAQGVKGDVYTVKANGPGGWVKVALGDESEGYLQVDGNATLAETTRQAEDAEAAARNQVVNYALQFVGGRYRYGGNDPRTGVDCSGFTRYVMQNAAGVSLNRSSGSQASQGRAVSAAEIQPGDLVFYGSGRRINHVALYIGDGQIVHASTERTGIKTSPWNYRTPVKMVSVLG